MFGCSKTAWHDAFVGLRSASGNGGGHFGWEVIQGELAKIKQVVDGLPKAQRDVGMLMYGPESEMTDQIQRRTIQLLWLDVYQRRSGDLKKHQLMRRLSELPPYAIRCAQLLEASDGERQLSHACVARMLEMTPANFARDLGDEYQNMVDKLRQVAAKGLMAVDEECRAIQHRYRQVA